MFAFLSVAAWDSCSARCAKANYASSSSTPIRMIRSIARSGRVHEVGEAGTSRQTGRDSQWRHWSLETAGGPLALRRKEVADIPRRLVVVNEVFDNHDGELEPTLGNRRTVAVATTVSRAPRDARVYVVPPSVPNIGRAAGQWRLTISLRCKPIECREYDSVWIVGNSSPIRFDHDCRVISDGTGDDTFPMFRNRRCAG